MSLEVIASINHLNAAFGAINDNHPVYLLFLGEDGCAHHQSNKLYPLTADHHNRTLIWIDDDGDENYLSALNLNQLQKTHTIRLVFEEINRNTLDGYVDNFSGYTLPPEAFNIPQEVENYIKMKMEQLREYCYEHKIPFFSVITTSSDANSYETAIAIGNNPVFRGRHSLLIERILQLQQDAGAIEDRQLVDEIRQQHTQKTTH